MGTNNAKVSIREMTPNDIPAVVELQCRTFPGMPAWTTDELLNDLRVFPDGQFVTTDGTGQILGSVSSLLIDCDDYSNSAGWSVITGNGTFSTHNPFGKTLYCADVGVDPNARRMGVGSLLYGVLKKLVRERGLKHLLTGGRIPGYGQVSQNMTPEEYVAEVKTGGRKDPTLSFHLANEFQIVNLVSNYWPDNESLGYVTLLEWLNPAYETNAKLHTVRPERELSHVLSERKRPSRELVAAMQYGLPQAV
jgi:ribosomal protein S18 acetylase RimI-like enzyme